MGDPKIHNCPNLKLGLRGWGGHQISIFSQIQKSPNRWGEGGGGQENYGLFHFLYSSFFNASLSAWVGSSLAIFNNISGKFLKMLGKSRANHWLI